MATIEYQTVARPYAQALFELAQEAGDYGRWSAALVWMSAIAADPQVKALVHNPKVDDETVAQVFNDVAAEHLFDEARSLLRLLIRNGRVLALPSIAAQFETMRADAEGTIEAELISARAVTDQHKSSLAESLSKRLGRQVTLRVVEDPTLIGGAILRAGDLVVDASVKGKLRKLAVSLAR